MLNKNGKEQKPMYKYKITNMITGNVWFTNDEQKAYSLSFDPDYDVEVML